MSDGSLTFEVKREELHTTRFVDDDVPELENDQALLRVDRFAYTANNITYALAGDLLGYWQFFPAADGWGRIPVWGYADVVESRHDEVPIGTRLYGYLPMSTHLVIAPSRVNDRDLVDASPHRSQLPPTYNTYAITTADPFYDAARENERMLLFPLFFTGFLIDDQLADNDFWGATSVIYSSASSKTAISAAHPTHQRAGIATVGLTSATNRSFVESLGIYDQVVAYDDVASLASSPAVFVDMAGSPQVRTAVHERFGDDLKRSVIVGGTHGGEGFTFDNTTLPGPEPAFFFAPDQIRKRSADWGRDELDGRIGTAWDAFLTWVDSWFRVEERSGRDHVRDAHVRTLDGSVDPSTGLVLSL